MSLSLTKLALALTLTLTAAAVPGEANAGPARAHTRARQVHQGQRIGQGVASGSLTRKEVGRLVRQQARINATKRRYVANDGHIGPREKAHLQRMQNRASRNIDRAKHNGRTR